MHEGAREIHLFGRGQGALMALFSAILHPRVASVVLKNAPLSCHQWTQHPLAEWPAALFVRDLLKEFDLPDCLRALGKRVKLIEPWDKTMKPLRCAVRRPKDGLT